ncbi:MAG: GPP34 family phosphoprotein [Alphaproteobacteria bacterium]|nr:GPP34 family phosphoprotein [Alphaproteobacteria bacterium]
MLTFVEEILLLMLDDQDGRLVDLPRSAMNGVVAGAVLMDLAMHDRIDSDLQELRVVDKTPTGDPLLDGALARLATSPAGRNSGAWVEELARDADDLREQALARLVSRGILRKEEGRFLWVFHTRRYPVIDDREQREVKARLRELVLGTEIPDPRDVVLVTLVEAAGLWDLLLTEAEQDKAAERIAQLRKMDLVGQAMTQVVRDIQESIAVASTMAW